MFRFNPSTYTVDEDVAGEQQTVSLQLISGTLTFSIDTQVSVTGGTARAIGMYHRCVGRTNRARAFLHYQHQKCSVVRSCLHVSCRLASHVRSVEEVEWGMCLILNQ